jgi:putative transposase
MRRNSTFVPGEFYHLYNRGTDKRKIFFNRSDHQRFLALLYLSNSMEPFHFTHLKKYSHEELFLLPRGNQIISIGAYCLMPNHFHILAREETEGGISMFMKKLLTGYSMYFNTKYERSGNLFQGRFKSSPVRDDDRYMNYLFAYIHLNPVKLIAPDWKERKINHIEKIKKFLNSYKYSSYPEFQGEKRPEGEIMNCSAFPPYFSEARSFEEFIHSWMEIKSYTEDRPR